MASGYSVQRGSVSFGSGDTTKTVTISSVDLSKSYIVFSVRQGDNSYNTGDNIQGILNVRGWISSSTQLSFNRTVSGYALVVEWFVVSASSGLTVQRGIAQNVGNTGVNISISSVDLTKSWVTVSSEGWNDFAPNRVNDIRADLTTQTNLFLVSRNNNAWNNYVAWEVIQDADASVQKISKSPTGVSDSVSISAVNLDKTFLYATSAMDVADQLLIGQVHWNYYLQDTTTINFIRSQSGDLGCDFTIYVVSDSAEQVSRYQTVFGSTDTSINVAINLSDVAKAAIIGDSSWFHSCYLSSSGTVVSPSFLTALTIDSTTQANVSRFASNSETGTMYWELLDFANSSLNVTPNGISSEESFGSLSISTIVDVSLLGIASEESFGDPGVVLANFMSIFGIASEEDFGILSINSNFVISPLGIKTAESVSSPRVSALISSVGNIPSAENWGAPLILRGTVSIQPVSIVSQETFGLPSAVAGTSYIELISLPSEEAFGIPSIGRSLLISSISSSEGFGVPSVVRGVIKIETIGIASVESFGEPAITPEAVNILCTGIATGEGLGRPTIVTGVVFVNLNGIPSSEEFGSPVLLPKTTSVNPTGIASAENFGEPSLLIGNVDVEPVGIPSGESFGLPYATVSGVQVSPYSIVSQEDFGSFTVSPGTVQITPSSISGVEQFGTPSVAPGIISVSVNGITSQESFGTVNLGMSIQVQAIISGESFGSFVVTTGNVDLTPYGIESQELFGSHIIRNVLALNFTGAGIGSSEFFGTPVVTVIVRNEFMQLMETDLEDVFFNDTEFAITSIYEHKTGVRIPDLHIIFDEETMMVDPDTGAEILSRNPMVQAISSQFTIAPAKGDKMVIKGVRYQVIDAKPDGTGVTVFHLHHERTV